jgi:hypothetical protein
LHQYNRDVRSILAALPQIAAALVFPSTGELWGRPTTGASAHGQSQDDPERRQKALQISPATMDANVIAAGQEAIAIIQFANWQCCC